MTSDEDYFIQEKRKSSTEDEDNTFPAERPSFRERFSQAQNQGTEVEKMARIFEKLKKEAEIVRERREQQHNAQIMRETREQQQDMGQEEDVESKPVLSIEDDLQRVPSLPCRTRESNPVSSCTWFQQYKTSSAVKPREHFGECKKLQYCSSSLN